MILPFLLFVVKCSEIIKKKGPSRNWLTPLFFGGAHSLLRTSLFYYRTIKSIQNSDIMKLTAKNLTMLKTFHDNLCVLKSVILKTVVIVASFLRLQSAAVILTVCIHPQHLLSDSTAYEFVYLSHRIRASK